MSPTVQKCEMISSGEKAEKHCLRLAEWKMKKRLKKKIKDNLDLMKGQKPL